MQKLLGNFKSLMEKVFSKKNIFIAIAVILIVIGGFFVVKKVFKQPLGQIYEVAVMARSQNNPDPAEDRKSSLKAGDVLIVQKHGHNWSTTESVSYLILKMNLTEEQTAKLTMSKEKEIKFRDLPEEEKKRIEDEKNRAKETDEKYFEESRMEILIAREHHIDMREFEDFEANDLLNGQPFDEVFDWGIVERK